MHQVKINPDLLITQSTTNKQHQSLLRPVGNRASARDDVQLLFQARHRVFGSFFPNEEKVKNNIRPASERDFVKI